MLMMNSMHVLFSELVMYDKANAPQHTPAEIPSTKLWLRIESPKIRE
jgi:hypothetical protein